MKKSVYSLVLTDDVVLMVDRLAYRNGTNRSNMINQILAEYVSYVTPEKRIREVFDRMEALLVGTDSLHREQDASETMMTLRSALLFKYNPTVRYHVDMYRIVDRNFGEFRVSMRTQNLILLCILENFFQVWRNAEEQLIGKCEYRQEPGKFTRYLCLRVNAQGTDPLMSNSSLGECILGYVRVFDQALKVYFANSDDPDEAAEKVFLIYRSYLNRCDALI